MTDCFLGNVTKSLLMTSALRTRYSAVRHISIHSSPLKQLCPGRNGRDNSGDGGGDGHANLPHAHNFCYPMQFECVTSDAQHLLIPAFLRATKPLITWENVHVSVRCRRLQNSTVQCCSIRRFAAHGHTLNFLCFSIGIENLPSGRLPRSSTLSHALRQCPRRSTCAFA